jgi:hypothetical protein
MTPEQFRAAAESADHRGSIVFARLDPNWTETFSEMSGGTDGLQSARPAKPFRVQPLPENIGHNPSGAFIINETGSRTNVSAGNLRGGQGLAVHDWMKTFAQNIKDTLPEGAKLPMGTQELIDAPTVDQMNLAAKNRLIEAGIWDDTKIASVGIDSFDLVANQGEPAYSFTLRGHTGTTQTQFFRPEGLAPHIAEAKKQIPFAPNNLGARMDPSMPTQVKPFSHVMESMQKSEAEMSARVAGKSLPRLGDEGVEVAVKRARSTGRMLGAANSASAAVAGGTSNSGALRAAGTLLNILT